MAAITEIAEWIRANDDFALMAHIRPDGDSLGSTLAMKLALNALGKRACVVYPGPKPAMYSFLPGFSGIVDEKSLPFEPEAVLVLDVSESKRLGDAAAVYERISNRCVIDHHEVKDCEVALNHIEPGAAATGEILYELFEELNIELSGDIALCLYTSMTTDTGNFTFSNTSPKTHNYCAGCIKAGVDVSGVSRVLFRLRTQAQVRLLGLALSAAEYSDDGKVAFVYLAPEMYTKAHAVHSDSDKIVNYLMDTEGVRIAILADNVDAGIKFSFRSIGDNDVAELAHRFGGGGHIHASGATIEGIPAEVCATVLKAAEDMVR